MKIHTIIKKAMKQQDITVYGLSKETGVSFRQLRAFYDKKQLNLSYKNTEKVFKRLRIGLTFPLI